MYKQEYLRKKLQFTISAYSKDKSIVDEYNHLEDKNFGIIDPIVESAKSYISNQTPYRRILEPVWKPSLSINYDSEMFSSFAGISILVLIISFFISICTRGKVRVLSLDFWSGLFDSLFVAVKIGILAFAVLSAVYIIKGLVNHIKRVQEVEEKNRQIQMDNKNIIENNNRLYDERKLQKSNMQKELDCLDVSIKETRAILEKYYTLNIVYPKYRNLTAISSFNEYFKSGRCTILTGHEGAYNIYEEEVRLDRILTKLDIIIEKLEEIKQNQHMLYLAIKEAKNTSENILRELKNISSQNIEIINNTNITAQNSQITAYNTQISAQNTEFLKWYQVYSN